MGGHDDVDIKVVSIGADTLYLVSWPVQPVRSVRLTTAEDAVLRAIAAGSSNAEIAQERGASVRTVANQVASLLRKFGVSSRHELVAVACAGGGDRGA